MYESCLQLLFYPWTEREHLGAQLPMTSISSGQACNRSNYIHYFLFLLHLCFFFSAQKRTKMVAQFYYGMLKVRLFKVRLLFTTSSYLQMDI